MPAASLINVPGRNKPGGWQRVRDELCDFHDVHKHDFPYQDPQEGEKTGPQAVALPPLKGPMPVGVLEGQEAVAAPASAGLTFSTGTFVPRLAQDLVPRLLCFPQHLGQSPGHHRCLGIFYQCKIRESCSRNRLQALSVLQGK